MLNFLQIFKIKKIFFVINKYFAFFNKKLIIIFLNYLYKTKFLEYFNLKIIINVIRFQF